LTLLISATHDDQPQFTLAKLLHEISQANAASFIVRTHVLPSDAASHRLSNDQSPLDTLPILLPCVDQAAQDILALMGEWSASKEVVIAVQEAIERMESSFDEDDVDDKIKLCRSLPSQLITLVELYASSKSLSISLKPAEERLQLSLALSFVARRPQKLFVPCYPS
jgi:hypothetical protein